MKVFVLHECENQGCCKEHGRNSFTSEVYGVFITEKLAKEFQKKNKYYRRATITEIEFYKKSLDK